MRTFSEFQQAFLKGDEQIISLPEGNESEWPNIIVKHGKYTAVIQLQGLGDHLSIDVHPFVDGVHARAGVIGMEDGFTASLPRTDPAILGTSHQWPATAMVTVMVGEQTGETPEFHA